MRREPTLLDTCSRAREGELEGYSSFEMPASGTWPRLRDELSQLPVPLILCIHVKRRPKRRHPFAALAMYDFSRDNVFHYQ